MCPQRHVKGIPMHLNLRIKQGGRFKKKGYALRRDFELTTLDYAERELYSPAAYRHLCIAAAATPRAIYMQRRSMVGTRFLNGPLKPKVTWVAVER